MPVDNPDFADSAKYNRDSTATPDHLALPADVETSFRIAERSAKSVAFTNQRTLDSILDATNATIGMLEGNALASLGRAAAVAAINDPL